VNILLLGETGVGKSTFINAIANYLTYETMEDALKSGGNILALIPTSFAVTDENFKQHTVSVGDGNTNENQDAGQSATQSCKSYKFPFQGGVIRLIDTPGIGDVRGIEQDKINMENILGFIGQHDELHGICILMKPNNSRLTVSFTFCIKELLCHLQKNASRNIVFVFTNSRGTFYKPGDTAPTLKAVLKDIESSPPYVSIPFVRENVYCFDSEAFRFLMALHNGIHIKDEQIFGESWKISVKECKRMVNYIANLIPHRVQDTVSINDARRLILDLSKPMAEIAQNIDVNLQVIEDRQRELLHMDADMTDLGKRLRIPTVDLKQVQLQQPTTVCTAPKCIEIRTAGLVSKTNYIQKCHNPCYLKGVQAEILNNTALLGCSAMEGTANCTKCGCSYVSHMHIYYEMEEMDVLVEDSAVKDLIAQKADGKALIRQSIKTLEKRSEDLLKEKEFLTKSVARFAIFLKNNAIAPYNDAFKDYLQHFIRNEQTKNTTAGAQNQTVIDGLQNMLISYEEEKRILDLVLNDSSKQESGSSGLVTAEDIKKLEQDLYGMKMYGARLRKFREGHMAARKNAQAYHAELVHAPPALMSRRHWVSVTFARIRPAVEEFRFRRFVPYLPLKK